MIDDAARGARYSDLFAEQQHHHADKSDCAYCPICSAIAVVRKSHPEVLEHLATAARELIMAAGILMQEAGKSDAAPPAQPEDAGRVRRIDIA